MIGSDAPGRNGGDPGRPDVAPDPSWRLLYRIGGVAAGLFVTMLVAAIVLTVVTPAAPTTGGVATLTYIGAHRTLYIVVQQLWLVPGVFALIVYLALYPAMAHLSRSLAALGAVVGGSAWALTLAIPTTSTGAPALVYLSDQFTATLDPQRRTSLATAAETLIAQNRTPGAVGVLTSVGMLIISVAMLKGVFPKPVAYLGITTGVLGIASEALRPVIEGGYGVYGVLLLAWTSAVGWALFRLGGPDSRQPSIVPPRPRWT